MDDGAILTGDSGAWSSEPLRYLTGEPPWPAKRNAMSLTRAGSRFVLFGGGVFGEEYFDDVWSLEVGPVRLYR